MGTNQSTPCSSSVGSQRAVKWVDNPNQPSPRKTPSSSHPQSQSQAGPEKPSSQYSLLPTITVEHNWVKPYLKKSIVHHLPTGEWFKYAVGTFHIPARHQLLNRGLDAPWFAEFQLAVDDLKLLSRVRTGAEGEEEEIFPWRANIEKAQYDWITVSDESHWAFPDRGATKPMYKRKILLGSTVAEEMRAPEGGSVTHTLEYEWKIRITIWSEDGDWLADELTYSKLGRLFKKETTVNTWATVRDSRHEPLAVNRYFLNKYHHHNNQSTGSNQDQEAGAGEITMTLDDMEAGHVESSLAVYLETLKAPSELVDEPGLRKIVEEHFGRHLYEQ